MSVSQLVSQSEKYSFAWLKNRLLIYYTSVPFWWKRGIDQHTLWIENSVFSLEISFNIFGIFYLSIEIYFILFFSYR